MSENRINSIIWWEVVSCTSNFCKFGLLILDEFVSHMSIKFFPLFCLFVCLFVSSLLSFFLWFFLSFFFNYFAFFRSFSEFHTQKFASGSGIYNVLKERVSRKEELETERYMLTISPRHLRQTKFIFYTFFQFFICSFTYFLFSFLFFIISWNYIFIIFQYIFDFWISSFIIYFC